MTTEKLILDVCDGNPGALRIATEIYRTLGVIYSEMVLQKAISLGYVGSELWILYKDECNENLAETAAQLLIRDYGPKGNNDDNH